MLVYRNLGYYDVIDWSEWFIGSFIFNYYYFGINWSIILEIMCNMLNLVVIFSKWVII